MCPEFELAINSLYSKGKYDVYVESYIKKKLTLLLRGEARKFTFR